MAKGKVINYQTLIGNADFETTSDSNPAVKEWQITLDTLNNNNDIIYKLPQAENLWDLERDDNFGTYKTTGIDISTFIFFITNIDAHFLLYFNNGAKFDAHFIVPFLQDSGFKQVYDKDNLKPEEFSVFISKGSKILTIKIGSYRKMKSHKKKTDEIKEEMYYQVEIRDMLLLFSGSIEKLGADLITHFSQPKDENFDYAGVDKTFADNLTKEQLQDTFGKHHIKFTNYRYKDLNDFKNHPERWKYLSNDTLIPRLTMRLREKFIPLSKWRLTTASTFYDYWGSMFAEQEIPKWEKQKLLQVYTDKKGYTQYKVLKINGKWSKPVSFSFVKKRIIQSYLPTKWLDLPNIWEEYDKYGNLMTNSAYIGRNYYRGGIAYSNHKGVFFANGKRRDITSSYPAGQKRYQYLPYGIPKIGDTNDPEYHYKYRRVIILNELRDEIGMPFNTAKGQSKKNWTKILAVDDTYHMEQQEWDMFVKRFKPKPEDIEVRVDFSFKTRPAIYFFGEYVDKWFNIKSTTKSIAEKETAKLGLNSPTGKFGQKNEVEQIIWDGEKITRKKGEDGLVVLDINKSQYYKPVIVAITSFGRMRLVEAVGDYGEDYYDGDTDSIHYIGDRIDNNIVVSNELGDWKDECLDKNGVNHPMFGVSRGAKQRMEICQDHQNCSFNILVVAGQNFNKNILDEDLEETDKLWRDELMGDFTKFIKGTHTNNQTSPKRLKTGIMLINKDKEIDPIWRHNKYDQSEEWYLNELEKGRKLWEKYGNYDLPNGWKGKPK